MERATHWNRPNHGFGPERQDPIGSGHASFGPRNGPSVVDFYNRRMITTSPMVSLREFEASTGWELKPEGACKGDICIPLATEPGDTIDIRIASEQMGLPLVHDADVGLFSLGPEAIGSRALATATAPDLELPDLEGEPLRLSSLRGQKVVIVAWAPY